MSIQVAFGGAETRSGDASFFDDAPNTWYEPGVTTLAPVEFVSPEADFIYLLVRRTGNDGVIQTFNDSSRWSIEVVNASTGDDVPYDMKVNEFYTGWNGATWTPSVLTVNVGAGEFRVRSFDVFVRDAVNNEHAAFRVLVTDDARSFSYIKVDNRDYDERRTTSESGTGALLPFSPRGGYVVMSPMTSFSETTAAEADFSFPPGRIFYKLSDAVNEEIFEYRIEDYSHSELLDVVSIDSVPGFPRAAVIRVDGYVKKILPDIGQSVWVRVSATSDISEQVDRFTIFIDRVNAPSADEVTA